MKDQYKKELEALPSYSILKMKDATLTAHLITTIYMQCMKEQGDLSDYFQKDWILLKNILTHNLIMKKASNNRGILEVMRVISFYRKITT